MDIIVSASLLACDFSNLAFEIKRAEDAQKRNRIRELEKEIEDTEVLIFELENAISDPEIASDYSKMSEKCKELEEVKTALDQKMDEWAELSDQLS